MKHIYIYIDMLHNITYRIRLEDVALVSFLVYLLNSIEFWLLINLINSLNSKYINEINS